LPFGSLKSEDRRKWEVGSDNIAKKSKTKYGEGEAKKYYTKFDAAVEVPL
jgi:hypothetical protein